MNRLIVCCDGTWQDLEQPYPTNVVKIAQAIKPTATDGTAQIVYYDEGIGTGGNTPFQKKLDRISGGGFGKGIDKNIQDGYRFLCLNYNPGDEIHLFGFSRGAYTVRSLAGLMYYSGLVTRPNIRRIPEAYKLYRSHLKPHHPDITEFRQKYGFRYEFEDRVPVTLLACWDTVGSLGIPDISPFLKLDQKINEKYRFHDPELSLIIKNALHAVAIDEKRSTFSAALMEKNNQSSDQKLIQKWFPGDHGSVGGGTQEKSGLSDSALQWMIDSTAELNLGLEYNSEDIPTGIYPDPKVDFDLPPTSFIGKLTRAIGSKERVVSDNFDDLHESVKQRWQARPDYRPENLQKHRLQLDQG